MKCPYCIKICSKCGKILVANTVNFYKQKKGKYGLKAGCKICNAQYQAQYRQDHKEEKAQYNAQYYQGHKEEHAQYMAQYYQDHKEEIAQQKAQYMARYRQTPQGKLVYKNAKHRRRTKTKQGKGYTLEQKQELLDFFKGCDAYTGKPMKEVSIDRIIPLNKGGEHEI